MYTEVILSLWTQFIRVFSSYMIVHNTEHEIFFTFLFKNTSYQINFSRHSDTRTFRFPTKKIKSHPWGRCSYFNYRPTYSQDRVLLSFISTEIISTTNNVCTVDLSNIMLLLCSQKSIMAFLLSKLRLEFLEFQ